MFYSIKNNLKAKFLIINHRLRPESNKEAKNVQKVLKKLKMILTVEEFTSFCKRSDYDNISKQLYSFSRLKE